MKSASKSYLFGALTLTLGLVGPVLGCSSNPSIEKTDEEFAAPTCCLDMCADPDEAELRSDLAYALAEEALARADANRHHARAAELQTDIDKAKEALDKLPTDRKLYFKIAANSISLGLELNGARQFAKGKKVEVGTGLMVCELDVATATMKVKEATKTVWQPPTIKEASVAAVKMGTGTTIQVLTADGDDWTAKIPVYGAIATIAKSGADLYGIGELRTAMQGFIDVVKKAKDEESKKEAAALKEADTHKKEADAAKKKLDEYLKNKKSGKCSDDDVDTIDDEPTLTPSIETPAIVRRGGADESMTLPVGNPAPAPAIDDKAFSTCGGSATWFEFESLDPEETTDLGNYCSTGGCPDSGAAEYCQIFGCE